MRLPEGRDIPDKPDFALSGPREGRRSGQPHLGNDLVEAVSKLLENQPSISLGQTKTVAGLR